MNIFKALSQRDLLSLAKGKKKTESQVLVRRVAASEGEQLLVASNPSSAPEGKEGAQAPAAAAEGKEAQATAPSSPSPPPTAAVGRGRYTHRPLRRHPASTRALYVAGARACAHMPTEAAVSPGAAQ